MNEKEALLAYVNAINHAHDLNLKHLDYLLNLPSIKNGSFLAIGKEKDELKSIYLLNGYLKHNMSRFYSEHLLKLKENVIAYSNKKSIDISDIKLDELMNSIRQTSDKILLKLDTAPSQSLTGSETLGVIRTLIDTTNIMLNFESNLKSLIDFEALDIQKGKSFKIFRDNTMKLNVDLMFYLYPRASTYKACLTQYTYLYEKLIDQENEDI